MNGGDLVRSVKAVSLVGTARGLRAVRASWRHRRADSVGLAQRGRERARVPGCVVGVEPGPGGGVVRFERSRLRITVTVSGAVFWGWDGAEPTPSYGVAGGCPEADPRAVLEPDKEGGWRVVSERATVAVSRLGAVTVCTPGGVLLRRDVPPRWWEPEGGGVARWVQRSEVTADARFFGLGGRASGPRLRDGTYAMWNTDGRRPFGPGDDPLSITMPVLLVVADAGTHLVFHDNSWDGTVSLREGQEGAGSGHDRPGMSELRMEGGPLRCWVVVGTPARVLHTWAQLTGPAAVPPSWALGHHHARQGAGGELEVRRVVDSYKERALPLEAVHVGIDRRAARQAFAVGPERLPSMSRLAEELRGDGVRLVSVVDPAVRAEQGDAVFDGGRVIDAFVRDAAGRLVRGVVGPGEAAYPDFTAKEVRKWWSGQYEERLAQGFSGFWHDMEEPAFGGPSLPRSARHALEGPGGDHREAHNVYALCMARAAYEALCELQPQERPFVFSRAGWVGMQRYGGAGSEEVTAGWPGLRASLSLVIGLGLCGVPYSGSDMGGFDEDPSAELSLRRLQLGAYLPLFRTRSGERAGRREPRVFGDEVLAHARVALNERRRLLPYFMSLAHLARLTGAPYVRPLWWGAPEDRALRDCEDAFLLGDCLLVAPVLEPGVVRRTVRLPRGRWYDTATGAVFDGPGQVTVDAPLSRIPVLVRAGSVLPVRGGSGAIELEVWAPELGRTGGGLVVPEPGDGREEPEVERYRVRWSEGRVVVEEEGERAGGEPLRPVHVRGLHTDRAGRGDHM
ncbi:glycoside hydrolase family 31 protein [Streptomyces kunmingensis]|uniref:Glycoside hydrolase family 31 protein n=1 Tax=Streptomyces kunmingensis TaxID=68225 RepID=A0ABU6C4S5_9ACTN|nr:glycoside hydrolase family 31 protein [Streptomyces kunmingensis]MEB3959116.1 glycoside hydrolase family 31 protein [Streptomyces kunmingensis]